VWNAIHFKKFEVVAIEEAKPVTGRKQKMELV